MSLTGAIKRFLAGDFEPAKLVPGHEISILGLRADEIKACNIDAIPDDDDDDELEKWTAFFLPDSDETGWAKWGPKCILLIAVASLWAFTYFSTNRARDYTSKVNKIGNLTELVALKTENLHHRLHNLEPEIIALKGKIFPQINWLSPAFGVEIIPSLCSPSKTDESMAKQATTAIENEWWWWPGKGIWQRYQHKEPEATADESKMLDPYGPYAALRSKLEHEPVYCAPPYDGKLYLAATLPRLTAPTSLIIEHWQKDTVLEIGSAPREFELWVKVPPGQSGGSWYSGAKVQRLMIERYGSEIVDNLAGPQRREMPEAVSIAFRFPWIPVGRWIYDIHGPSPIQQFFLPVNLSDYKIYAQEVAIRVNSNWGSVNSTCLVQVKLHGHIKDGIKDGIELPESDLESSDTRKEPNWYYSEYEFEPDNITISDSEKEFFAMARSISDDRIEEWKTPNTTEGIQQAEASRAEKDARASKIPVTKEDAVVKAELLQKKKDERASKIPVTKEDAVVKTELLQKMAENERTWDEEFAKRLDEDNARVKEKNEKLRRSLYGGERP
ncbi:Mitochondrial fission protein [Peltigera leucophlebia]|nr:Mitochondrial fission protein [Peltigera leucophlebia]